MIKRLVLLVFVSAAFTSCTSLQRALPKVPAEGTQVVLPANGSRFWGPKLTIHNFAGKGVTIVPVSGGKPYPAAYKMGKRSFWCLGLCREKTVIGYFAICNGSSLAIPLVENTDSYYDRRMSLELYIYENKQLVGRYFFCVINQLYHNSSQQIVFNKYTLQSMKAGRYGEICQRARQYW